MHMCDVVSSRLAFLAAGSRRRSELGNSEGGFAPFRYLPPQDSIARAKPALEAEHLKVGDRSKDFMPYVLVPEKSRLALQLRLAALLAFLAVAAGCHMSSSGDVVLRFWAMGREGEVVTALVPEFERTHPGVRVVVQQLPWTAAHEKLL